MVIQRKYISEAIVYNLTSSTLVVDCVDALLATLRPFLLPAVVAEFPKDLLAEVANFVMVLSAPVASCLKVDVDAVASAIKVRSRRLDTIGQPSATQASNTKPDCHLGLALLAHM
jgi:hypothetical protein